MTATWERRLIETRRGRFEVFVRGTGLPICVTHLYSEFNESGDRFANQFVPYGQVFLVNLKETGQSPRVQHEEELSMWETVRDLEGIREALGLSTWNFAGHSTGGMLGIVYALESGASLHSLVVVGSAARNYTAEPSCIYNRAHPQFQYMQDLLNMLKDPALPPEDRVRMTVARTQLSLHHPEHYETYFGDGITKKFAGHRLHYFDIGDMPRFQLLDQLHAITTPTLLLCGRHDVQCPLPCSVEMQERIPGAQLVIFEASNHYPFLEEPAQFTEVVGAFYRSFV